MKKILIIILILISISCFAQCKYDNGMRTDEPIDIVDEDKTLHLAAFEFEDSVSIVILTYTMLTSDHIAILFSDNTYLSLENLYGENRSGKHLFTIPPTYLRFLQTKRIDSIFIDKTSYTVRQKDSDILNTAFKCF